MNKLIFGMDYLNIVQSYDGKFTHYKQMDYPIDVMGRDSAGRDWFWCPCDQVTVKRVYGVGTQGVNTVWVESDTPVDLADGTCDIVTIMFVHPEDDDMSRLKVGQCFCRGERMFREGNDGSKLGLSTGNHLHISVAKGKFVPPYGWYQNKNGAWDILGKPIKPEQSFYVDQTKTKVINTCGLNFKPC